MKTAKPPFCKALLPIAWKYKCLLEEMNANNWDEGICMFTLRKQSAAVRLNEHPNKTLGVCFNSGA